jgi:hypothetical protein
MDAASQVRRGRVLAVRIADWLRDEEATRTAESGRKCLEPMAGLRCVVHLLMMVM